MCNFLSFSLCPLPLIMSLDTTGKGLAPLSLSPSSGVYTRLYDPPPGPWLLEAEQFQLS